MIEFIKTMHQTSFPVLCTDLNILCLENCLYLIFSQERSGCVFYYNYSSNNWPLLLKSFNSHVI